jgi:hypothetical protein
MMTVSGTRLSMCEHRGRRAQCSCHTQQRTTPRSASLSPLAFATNSVLPRLGPLGPPAGYRVRDIIPLCSNSS